jgi:2',3'-cyclic-nucleotide 2'-phosphodiesterase (5'-nucleotidase family)
MRGFTRLLALLFVVGGARTADAQVTIIQINDIYRIDAVDNGNAGGMGRVSTLIDAAKKRGEQVLLLHGGDFISPSLESRYWGGMQMIDAMNFLHAKAPMIVVPGNHEYDAGADSIVANAIAGSRFPWLAANLRLTTRTPAANARIQADTLITIGGIRFGIFGLTLLDDARSYATVDTAYMRIAEQRITALEQRGADVVLALTHLPIEVDVEMAKLRRTHPKFMWIVSGHEHNVFSFPLSDTSALITNGESNARHIFRATFNHGRPVAGQPATTFAVEQIALDTSIVNDPVYKRTIEDRYRAGLQKFIPLYDLQIGTSSTPMDGREETVRGGESTLGNYLTDVMRTAYPDVPADIGVLNGGSIRIDDVVQGPIRWEHIARTFGFPTRVGLVWLRGSDVRSQVLEKSVSGEEGHGRFLQVSGVRFSFDRRRPPMSRVTSVEVQKNGTWQPIDPGAVYVVAVPDYGFYGGDGYLYHNRSLMSVPPGPDLRLMVFQSLLDAYARGQAIAPRLEGRITEIK